MFFICSYLSSIFNLVVLEKLLLKVYGWINEIYLHLDYKPYKAWFSM